MKAWHGALAAALLGAGSAFAQPGIYLEDHTTPELSAAISGGKTTILIPIGGTEQNEAHIALGKHNARVRFLAEAIAVRLGNALVAPVIAYVPQGSINPPTGHMRGAGTISIPEAAFEQTLEGAARSLLAHGFQHVVFLGDHGGYHRNLRRVAERMNRGAKAPVVLVPPEYYREVEHAGVEDTAMTLAAAPSMVREAKGATVEQGRTALDTVIARTVEAVKRATAGKMMPGPSSRGSKTK